jgi:type II secretory pathway predicted ATPase ExeA
MKDIEKELVQAAVRHVQSNKTLLIVIDDAHLLEIDILRKLRLLFERFPKKHNLVLLGHPELLHRLSLLCNEDIKSGIRVPLKIRTISQFPVNETLYETL